MDDSCWYYTAEKWSRFQEDGRIEPGSLASSIASGEHKESIAVRSSNRDQIQLLVANKDKGGIFQQPRSHRKSVGLLHAQSGLTGWADTRPSSAESCF